MKEVSKVNKSFEFSEAVWVISLLNTGEKTGGHSVIVVEGFASAEDNENLEKFIGEYHITIKNDKRVSGFFKTITVGDIQVRIHDPSTDQNGYHPQIKHAECESSSWYVKRAKAIKMINEIKHERDEILGGSEQSTYNLKGAHASDGDNCYTWAKAKLIHAGITISTTLSDLFKAAPGKHVGKTGDVLHATKGGVKQTDVPEPTSTSVEQDNNDGDGSGLFPSTS